MNKNLDRYDVIFYVILSTFIVNDESAVSCKLQVNHIYISQWTSVSVVTNRNQIISAVNT